MQHLSADLVFIVRAAFHHDDAFRPGDIQERRAVRGDKKLIAFRDQAFELPHQAALRVRMQEKFRLLDAKNCPAFERASECVEQRQYQKISDASPGFAR